MAPWLLPLKFIFFEVPLPDQSFDLVFELIAFFGIMSPLLVELAIFVGVFLRRCEPSMLGPLKQVRFFYHHSRQRSISVELWPIWRVSLFVPSYILFSTVLPATSFF
ncbi:UNVERIFIED_CONTAM: hypothetical protein Sradi_1876300 [Sesamum radiatum]|uniref:Uncharacterized protein n=1 Tax=Sesamum radiatum TaxID=300843 RepID=A0AAW2TXI2_SESRA